MTLNLSGIPRIAEKLRRHVVLRTESWLFDDWNPLNGLNKILNRPTLQSVGLFPEHELVSAAQNEMRGHELFLAAVRRSPESVHQPNLFAHGSPKSF